MTLNAADLLVDFFQAERRSRFDFAPLWAAVMEIESNLSAWGELQQDVSHFRGAMDRAKKELRSSLTSDFGFMNPDVTQISQGDIGVLGWISEKLNNTARSFDDASREKVREAVGEVARTVLEDTSLPEELRLHIARLIRHVESCLDDWEIKGDFLLADALDRLTAAVHLAEAKSDDPAKWNDLWQKWIRPVSVGLIAGVPQVSLQVSQMLAITGGGG